MKAFFHPPSMDSFPPKEWILLFVCLSCLWRPSPRYCQLMVLQGQKLKIWAGKDEESNDVTGKEKHKRKTKAAAVAAAIAAVSAVLATVAAAAVEGGVVAAQPSSGSRAGRCRGAACTGSSGSAVNWQQW